MKISVDEKRLTTYDFVTDPDAEKFSQTLVEVAKERQSMRLWVLDAYEAASK